MPYSDGDFRWWDLEDPELLGHIYNVLAPIQLGENDYNGSWEQFQRENPAGAYAWVVGTRYKWLEDAIVGLRPVQKLLANPDLPVRTDRGNINRDEWLRLSLDLFLFRFAGIRDHCLHLVNELYELGLAPLDVRLTKVLKRLPSESAAVGTHLSTIAQVATGHRDERNRRAHEGVQRELIEGVEEQIFKMLAMEEERDAPTTGTAHVSSKDEGERLYDVRERFRDVAATLDRELVPAAESLIETVTQLVDELAEPFLCRYAAKHTGDEDGAA